MQWVYHGFKCDLFRLRYCLILSSPTLQLATITEYTELRTITIHDFYHSRTAQIVIATCICELECSIRFGAKLFMRLVFPLISPNAEDTRSLVFPHEAF